MRSSRWVPGLLCAMAIGVILPAWAQSPADATKPASEAPATPPAASTLPAGVPTAPSAATAPSNPTAVTGAPAVATSAVPTTQAPAAPSGTIATTSAKNTPDILKLARTLGLRPETAKGYTRYCRTDANLGTRFATKKCYDDAGVLMLADAVQIEKTDMMRGSDYCPAICFK